MPETSTAFIGILIVCVFIAAYLAYVKRKKLNDFKPPDRINLIYEDKRKNNPELTIILDMIEKVIKPLMEEGNKYYDENFLSTLVNDNSFNEFCAISDLSASFQKLKGRLMEESRDSPYFNNLSEKDVEKIFDYYQKIANTLKLNLCTANKVDANKLYGFMTNIKDYFTSDEVKKILSISFYGLHETIVKIIDSDSSYTKKPTKFSDKINIKSVQPMDIGGIKINVINYQNKTIILFEDFRLRMRYMDELSRLTDDLISVINSLPNIASGIPLNIKSPIIRIFNNYFELIIPLMVAFKTGNETNPKALYNLISKSPYASEDDKQMVKTLTEVLEQKNINSLLSILEMAKTNANSREELTRTIRVVSDEILRSLNN